MSKWTEIKSDYYDNGFVYIDAWETADDSEEGKVIAWVDNYSGRVIYADPVARVDSYAQHVINDVVDDCKKNHPYSVEELEELLRNVVYDAVFNMTEADAVELALECYGFTPEQMEFFGMPKRGE